MITELPSKIGILWGTFTTNPRPEEPESKAIRVARVYFGQRAGADGTQHDDIGIFPIPDGVNFNVGTAVTVTPLERKEEGWKGSEITYRLTLCS